MAKRRTTSRRPTRSRSSTRSRPRRTAKRRTTNRGTQTIRIVLEQPSANSASVPGLGLTQAPPPRTKPRF